MKRSLTLAAAMFLLRDFCAERGSTGMAARSHDARATTRSSCLLKRRTRMSFLKSSAVSVCTPASGISRANWEFLKGNS
jgi:hypothetical protein